VKALAGQTAKATEDIGAQISGMQHATMRSIEAIGAIERTIRNIGEISGAIAAAVTEQGAATQEIARSVETAAVRTSETAPEVVRVGEATAETRDSAMSVKTVADDLGAVAGAFAARSIASLRNCTRPEKPAVFISSHRTLRECGAGCGLERPARHRTGCRECAQEGCAPARPRRRR